MPPTALLVNPPTPTSSYAGREGRCTGEGAFALLYLTPLALLHPASVLEARGWRVRVRDGVVDPSPASARGCDLVVVNVSPSSYTDDLALMRRLKEEAPGAVVAAMGALPTAAPARILGDGADAVLRGEVEATVALLADAVALGRPPGALPGLSAKAGERVVHGPPQLRPDLDALPHPARHLVDGSRYRFLFTGEVATSVLTGRGCPHRCTFCTASLLNGRRSRDRSPEAVAEEMSSVRERDGTRQFVLFSDTFNASRSFVLGLCDAIGREGLDVGWACNGRADGLDAELLSRMARAGCRVVTIGGESGSDRVLRRARKGLGTSDVRRAVSACRRAGVTACVYFMLGLPGETRESVRETVGFARSLDTDHVLFSVATPYAGTEFAREAGLSDDDVSRARDEVHAIVPAGEGGLPPPEVEESVRSAFASFYLRPGVVARHALRLASSPSSLLHAASTALELGRYLATGRPGGR